MITSRIEQRQALEARGLLGAFFLIDLADRATFDYEEFALCGIVAKFFRTGTISQKQIDFCKEMLEALKVRGVPALDPDVSYPKSEESDNGAGGAGVIPTQPLPQLPPRGGVAIPVLIDNKGFAIP